MNIGGTMKLLIEKIDDNFDNLNVDGIILSLKDLSVQSIKYYSLDGKENIIQLMMF